MGQHTTQTVADEWVTFPGGELEGRRPRTLCSACREALNAAARAGTPQSGSSLSRGALCFQCYRAELDRERALGAAGELDTASDARFQTQLPFEPVNTARLAMLKVERATAHGVMLEGAGRFVDKRRQAQIAARHALQAIVAGVMARRLAPGARDRAIASALHAAELQLPESWLPFVVSR
jgi:hypothetical protein